MDRNILRIVHVFVQKLNHAFQKEVVILQCHSIALGVPTDVQLVVTGADWLHIAQCHSGHG